MKKKIIISTLIIMILIPMSYILFLVLSYNRIEDNQNIEITNNKTNLLEYNKEYKLLTYNIGFGAYSQNFSFFMEKGVTNGSTITGKQSRASSKEDVLKNIKGMNNVIAAQKPDFVFLQEVDYNSTRSYHINQLKEITKDFDYASTSAINFHTPYLLYPFHEFHGSVSSGLVSLSNFKIETSTRYSLPITTNIIDRLFELDRAIIVNRYPIGEKQLVLINVHLSAYDKDGIYREKQINYLKEWMEKEYIKGNYVVIGGDFNHDLINDLKHFKSIYEIPSWISKYPKELNTETYKIYSDKKIPTVRSSEQAYVSGENYVAVIDGFIVTNNIKVNQIENINTEFMYSDHNPVLITFELLTP